MSAAVNSRAAVSFGSPQDVEVLVDGAWVPGAMLGWRHDDAGRCEAWVRLRTGGRGTPDAEADGSWVALATVRLPERHLALASVPATAAMPAVGAPAATSAPAPATAAMTAVAPGVPGGRARRSRRHCAEVTAEQPAVPVVGAGRHRAPAGPVPGRHRALTAEMPAVSPEPTHAAPAAGTPTPAAAASQPAAEPDLLTRPIRLGDLVSGPRGGRPGVRPTV